MNAALTIVFFISTLVFPIIWLVMWIKFDPSKFDVECSFMCKRVKQK